MLNLKIISPEKIEFAGEAECVTMPGVDGEFQVLQNHAPLISLLGAGNVVFRGTSGEHSITITSGFVEVQKNNVSLCVEL